MIFRTLLLSLLLFTLPTLALEQTESTYDRVMRTNTLRCGYGTWEPGVYKDLKTGRMAGLFVELTEAMAQLAGLKVEWVGETDWGQIPEAINSDKIDAFCAGMANDAARARHMLFTKPFSYWSFDVIVRADDVRFPAGETVALKDLNKPEFSTAYTEGDVLETIAKTEFPVVKGVPLPPLGTPADNLVHVITKKTDFVVFPRVMYQNFSKLYPGEIRYLKVSPSLRVYGNVLAIAKDELYLQQALNAAIDELTGSGMYEAVMKKYNDQYPNAFLPVAKPYAVQGRK